MSWIEPLELETWFINVFSGSAEIFGVIALIFIAGMAGFFRMTGVVLFFMVGLFLLMFSGYIGINFLVIFGLFGGLIAGYVLSKILER
jgi:hypothetical protein